jgi:hypothetical protein
LLLLEFSGFKGGSFDLLPQGHKGSFIDDEMKVGLDIEVALLLPTDIGWILS